MQTEQVPVVTHTHVVLKKFDGDVPQGCEDPEAAGFMLLEEIVIDTDELTGEQTVERKVYE